jgi:hypothetical protein
MSANAKAALLAVACLLQITVSDTPPSAEKSSDGTPQGSNLKSLRVNWEVQVPFVACDKGTPVLNVEFPDANAPKAICPGVQPPDTLPQRAHMTASASQDAAYEVGTVIAIGVSHDKIVMAADSRNTLFFKERLADGTVKTKYDDCACKLTQLTPTILFAADGLVRASDTISGAILYDAHKLARLAARNYHSNPQEEAFAGGRIPAVATRWAWDVDFRMHHGFTRGWTPRMTLEGIFAGLESDGEIAIAVAKLEYPTPQSVTLTVRTPQTVPTDFTWVEAFGINEVAKSYYDARAMTEQTKAENKKISAEILKDPRLFSPHVPELLVDLTIQQYQAAAGQGRPMLVHGPIDSAVLERNKKIEWIHWKKCSGASAKSVASPSDEKHAGG